MPDQILKSEIILSHEYKEYNTDQLKFIEIRRVKSMESVFKRAVLIHPDLSKKAKAETDKILEDLYLQEYIDYPRTRNKGDNPLTENLDKVALFILNNAFNLFLDYIAFALPKYCYSEIINASMTFKRYKSFEDMGLKLETPFPKLAGDWVLITLSFFSYKP